MPVTAAVATALTSSSVVSTVPSLAAMAATLASAKSAALAVSLRILKLSPLLKSKLVIALPDTAAGTDWRVSVRSLSENNMVLAVVSSSLTWL